MLFLCQITQLIAEPYAQAYVINTTHEYDSAKEINQKCVVPRMEWQNIQCVFINKYHYINCIIFSIFSYSLEHEIFLYIPEIYALDHYIIFI